MADAQPDLGGVLSQLFNGSVANVPDALKSLSSGISSSNEMAKGANQKAQDFYTGYDNGRVNLPLLALSAGFLKPTVGGFTGSMGNAFDNYGGALLKSREMEMDRQTKLQTLQSAQAALARQSAMDQYESTMRPLSVIPAIGGAIGPMADIKLFSGATPGAPGSPTQAKAGIGAPMGLPSAPMGAPASAAPPKQSLGDFPAPEQGGIPAPAPGRVEASPLPPLQGALTEGAAADAGGAALMREMQLPEAQQILQEAVSNPQKYATPDGEKTVQQAIGVANRAIAQRQQAAQAPGGASPAPAPAPAPAPVPAPTTTALPPAKPNIPPSVGGVPKMPPEGSGNDGVNAASLRRAQTIRADAEANPGKYLGTSGKDLLKRADEIIEKSAQFKGDVAAAEAKGKLPSEISKSSHEKWYTTQNKAKEEAFAEAQQGATAMSQAKAMMDVMFPKGPDGKPAVNGGPLGPVLSHTAAVAKQLGFSDDFVKRLTGTDPNNAQELEKLKVAMGTEIAKQTIGPGSQLRVAEFQQFMQTTPSDQLLPQAFKWIIEKTIVPKAQQQMSRWEKVADLDPGEYNIQSTLFNHDKANPWYSPKQPQAAAAADGSQGKSIQQQAAEEIARRRAQGAR
ncbi:hypothetical protein UFOVP1204_25 [uncultured Caudovirales phage]|uniref:Uncharacterized protein n=1 Tax=uncultured Caudovirales phage TaxID=2100421 RepID=A0A6J5MIU7_9CAUD|nr:hypothetical protein UFOVP473_2 [uncultured Caudovirales phage]CAB4176108.1 hypothetical protein UFOVP983_2 [uncultured Caudovirales phage]CAB4189795.1 hypothetical protein UFOVP1204_25 [uncultured Caudovirales phage]